MSSEVIRRTLQGRSRPLRGESAPMAGRRLHDALRDFVLESAAFLTDELKAGAELPFVLEERGSHTVLYSYRAMTAEFIDARWPSLRALPAYEPAADALASSARAYLRLRGLPGDDSETALRDILQRSYEESSSFGFPEERFEAVCAELEQTVSQTMQAATVLARLDGVTLESARIELGGGLALAPASAIDAPPQALAGAEGLEASEGAPPTVCLLEREVPAEDPLPIADGQELFSRALTALRLAGAGDAALSPLLWARSGRGAWQAATLPGAAADSSRSAGRGLRLSRDEEAEVRELIEVLAAGRAPGGAVGWALRRFEMGCERAEPREALSDHLLGLRALLARGDDGARLPLRVAALCAGPDDRRLVRHRVELACALESFVIGADGDDYVDAIGPESPAALIGEVEQHLRALLRDVLCGYLDADLATVADELLLSTGDEGTIAARDTRAEGGEAAGAGEDTEELEAVVVASRPERHASSEAVAEDEVPADAAVTPSADWAADDFDEDPASYSAPV